MTRRRSSHSRPAVTLATVAEAVGVSRMTVSNAYNRPDQLSPELRNRVFAVAEELGYSGPNPVARTLSRGETGSIGLVLDYPLTLALTDPAAQAFVHGVAAGTEERGLGLSLVPRIDGRHAALVQAALVDGFVLYCVPEDDPRMDAVRARRLPFVGVDFDPRPGLVRVNIDDRGAARSAAQHLTALGHRRFGVVLAHDAPDSTGAEAEAAATHHVERERLAGWREGLEAAGIDWGEVPVATPPGKGIETGRLGAARLLDRAERPTAILGLSDLIAMGVIQAARDRGISVPRQLSVTGFDDIAEAALSDPPLTTIRQPLQLKGSEAVRLLLEGEAAQSVLLPTELVVRASTSPAP
jgi:DNA-binding LacI/PurR family transcriptional regulator